MCGVGDEGVVDGEVVAFAVAAKKMRWWVGLAVCEEVLGEFLDRGEGVAGGEG